MRKREPPQPVCAVAKRCACGRHAAAARMLSMLTATELACIGQHPHRADAECGPVPCGSLSERARHRSCGRAAQLADARAVARDCFHAHARNSCSHATSRLLHMASGAPTAHAATRVDRSSSRAAAMATQRRSARPVQVGGRCVAALNAHRHGQGTAGDLITQESELHVASKPLG